MSKKFITGLSIGLGIPLISGGVIFGVPSIRNKIIKPGTDTSVLESRIDELEKANSSLSEENTNLKQNNLTYAGKIENLSSELTIAKSSIEQKNAEILNKESIIHTLTNEKSNIQKELDKYKELAGSDVNYIEIINSLQTQLEEKTNSLDSATAELEQLRTDKSSLQTRVLELEEELEKVKKELSNYKSLDSIDKLNISNFNGTWYLNGSFQDYYVIENGVVTKKANEDKGLLNSIYNQMYLMMNSSGGTAIELSDDGTQFTTETGDVYSKFYINTVRTVTPTYMFCGTYNFSNNEIKLNTDNTTTFSDGTNTYNGAYIVNSKERNIGGNVTIFNTITCTYQINGESVVKIFENSSKNNILIDENSNNYDCKSLVEYPLLKPVNSSVLPSSYYKIVVKFYSNFVLKNNSYIDINYSYG